MPSSRSVRKTRTAISPRLATRTLPKRATSGRILPSHERSRSAHARPRTRRPVRRAPVRARLPGPQLLGDRGVRRRDGDRLVRREGRAAPRSHVAARLAARPGGGQDPRARRDGHARRGRCLSRLDGGSDRRARVPRLGAPARRARAWRRAARARPRVAEDVVAGGRGRGRRVRGCRCVARSRRVVGAADRGRFDVAVRAGLRPRRAEALARRRPGLTPLIRRRPRPAPGGRLVGLLPLELERPQDRLPLLLARLRRDLDGHGRRLKGCRRGPIGTRMRRRSLLLCALVAVLAAAPSGAAKTTPSWAQAEIRAVVAAGLMANDPATFRPDDPLTRGALEQLVAGLTEATPVTPASPAAKVTMAGLDARFVSALGL